MRPTKALATRLRELVDQYSRESGLAEYTVTDALAWAIESGRLDPRLPPELSFEAWKDLWAVSLQSDTIKVNGRIVRVRLCVRVDVPGEDAELTQRYLWSHVNDSPRDFMERALQQQRDGIERDGRRWLATRDYCNQVLHGRGERPLQMDLPNLRDDLESGAG